MKYISSILTVFAFAAIVLAGCTGADSSAKKNGGHDDHEHSEGEHDHNGDDEHDHDAAHNGHGSAIAMIFSKSGSTCTGSASFHLSEGVVTLVAAIEDAKPGEHAIHIHEVGDCSSDDGKSAGGHWNPTAEDHGRWGGEHHHSGDIGNITVGEDGKGSITLTTNRWTIGGGAKNDILGKSVIVHAVADDFTSQPSGAAGARIGCGVIEIDKSHDH